jgi:hypothetical protein
MIAFIPVLFPLVPALVGACAGAAVVSACKPATDSKDGLIRELKSRVEALEKERKS